MTRAILTTAGAAAAAVALAGCGGGGHAAGTTVGTTAGSAGGVAGVQTTRRTVRFEARVHGLQRQLTVALRRLGSGDVVGAARVGGPLLTHCRDTVATLSARATTSAQQQAVSHLRTACQDMANASAKGASGDLAAAKQLAQQALAEARQASSALR